MRHALERIDVSENVARRKRFEFVTLAGVACGLIGFGAFAGAAFVQGGHYKGILYIGAGLVVCAFSLYLRARGFTSAVSYTDRLQSGEGTDRVAVLQLSSEVIVLSGAWALFANAVLAVLTDGGIELLSLAGLIMLIVGVNLSLRVEESARAKERELWERGLRPMVLLLPSSGNDALRVRGRFSLARAGSSYPAAGFTRVIRELLNDAGQVVTVSDSDYFVTTQFVRMSKSKEIYEMSVGSIMIREEELIERLLAQQPSAKATLERLRVRFEGRSGYGAFAPIRNRGCGACKVTIASQGLQRAQRGVFITCANCARFLYIAAVE